MPPRSTRCDTMSMTSTESSAASLYRFEPDRCANCFEPLPNDLEHRPVLFCSELCQQTASDVRYWRKALRVGTFQNDPEVREAINMRLAHLLAGGYNAKARTIPASVRSEVVARDKVCVRCGAAGEEIDHMNGDSNDPADLQFLCGPCHRAKTAESFVPASEEQQAFLADLEQRRVLPHEPALLCDDEAFWEDIWRKLHSERLKRIEWSDVLEFEEPFDSSEAIIAEIQAYSDRRPEIDDSYYDDHEARGEDDDSGYGPDSYFAHALGKDD